MLKEKYTYIPASQKTDAIPIWFCFPAEYSIGMSSLGYLSLFRLFDEHQDIDPERIFTDTAKTRHHINDVKLVGFSNSFEFDFLNIFKILEKHKIPFSSSERGENHPLIFGGGPVLSANPEPFADIFDFIILGDGEEVLLEIIEKYKNVKNLKRNEIIAELALIEGVYVPSFYEVDYNNDGSIKDRKAKVSAIESIKKRCVQLSSCVYSPIVTADTMFSDSFLIEFTRGCPRICNFCLASYSNLPSRCPSKESILEAIDTGIKLTGKIGLLGALITEHPDFEEICSYISNLRDKQEFEVSVSSLRTDSITPEIVQMLTKCGQKNLTIAIEAGSQRLRDFINKNLSEEQIIATVQTAIDNGLLGLKIYGMIGLPTETDEDILELVVLLKKIKKLNNKFSITLSISSFVPKANTPFQWYGRDSIKNLERKTTILKKELHKAGIKFRPTSIKWDNIQGILSRGNRTLSPILRKVYQYGGTIGSWGRAFKEVSNTEGFKIPQYSYFYERTIPFEENLPWDFIETGVSKQILYKRGNF